MPLHSPLHGRPHGVGAARRLPAALGLPLLRRLAFRGPGVDGGDFVFQGRVDEAVPLEGLEVLELGGYDEGCEGLAAATFFAPRGLAVCDFDGSLGNGRFRMWCLEERFTGHVCDLDVDCAEALGDCLAEGGFRY